MGEVPPEKETHNTKNPAAVALGRLGGLQRNRPGYHKERPFGTL
jgi:hypothetical protein